MQQRRSATIASWTMQVIAAVILLQTLPFKFAGAELPVYIFTTLGAEPGGRIGSALIELFVGVGLLIPATAGLAAVVGIGVMVGALAAHLLTPLGIAITVPDSDIVDDASLFVLGLITLACCIGVAWLRRGELPVVGEALRSSPAPQE